LNDKNGRLKITSTSRSVTVVEDQYQGTSEKENKTQKKNGVKSL
jgi:hypothetical protein